MYLPVPVYGEVEKKSHEKKQKEKTIISIMQYKVNYPFKENNDRKWWEFWI